MRDTPQPMAMQQLQGSGTAIMKRIYAPWSNEEVVRLNVWQQDGYVHECVCPNPHQGSRVLVADNDGWHCPSCAFRQDWAHEKMLGVFR